MKEVLFNIKINVQDEKELNKIQTRMDQLIKRQKELSTQNKKSTAEYQKNNVELKALRQQHTQLSNSLRDQMRTEGLAANSLVRMRLKLRELISEYDRGDAAMRQKLLPRIQNYNQLVTKAEQATGRYQRQVGKYQSVFTNAVASLKSFAMGMMGATAILMGFIRGIRSSIKTFIDFETTFSNVLTLLDKAQKKEFGGLLKEGAADLIGQFGFQIQDLNKALFDAISAGIPAGDAINYMRQASVLAVGGASDLTSVILGSTKIMNAYNLTTAETNRIMNALFTAQKFGQTTVQELAQSIGVVTSAGQQARIPYQELLAVFAVLTKRLKNTDETATAMNATLSALMKPGREAEELFNKLGIQVGITGIRQQGLFNILQKIVAATDENADALTTLIPNIRALRGVGAMTTETLKEYEEILATINEDYGEGSSLVEAYTEKVSTVGQQWKQFTGNIKQAVLESEKINRIMLAANILLMIHNKLASEAVDLSGEMGEMEERLALIAKEKANALLAEAEKLRKIEEEKQKAAEAEKQRIEAIKKDWEEKLAIITEEEEIKKGDAEWDKVQHDWVMDSIDATTKAREDAATKEREVNERRMEQEEEDRKTEAELREQELEDEFKQREFAEKRKEALREEGLRTALMIGDALIAINRGKMEKEIEDAGDNEAKIAEIRKKYAKKEQIISIGKAIISGAEGIIKTGANLGYPLAIPFQILQAIQTLAQIAIIKSQTFAKGGQVKGIGDKDTVPIMATPGEGMINARSMASQDVLTLTGRPFDIASQINSYKGFGIPYASGGVIPSNTYNTYNQFDESTINRIISAINAREIKVYQNVNEVISAQNEIKVTQQTSEL